MEWESVFIVRNAASGLAHATEQCRLCTEFWPTLNLQVESDDCRWNVNISFVNDVAIPGPTVIRDARMTEIRPMRCTNII